MDLEGSVHSAACVTDLAKIAGETCRRKSTVLVRGPYFVVTFAAHWNIRDSL